MPGFVIPFVNKDSLNQPKLNHSDLELSINPSEILTEFFVWRDNSRHLESFGTRLTKKLNRSSDDYTVAEGLLDVELALVLLGAAQISLENEDFPGLIDAVKEAQKSVARVASLEDSLKEHAELEHLLQSLYLKMLDFSQLLTKRVNASRMSKVLLGVPLTLVSELRDSVLQLVAASGGFKQDDKNFPLSSEARLAAFLRLCGLWVAESGKRAQLSGRYFEMTRQTYTHSGGSVWQSETDSQALRLNMDSSGCIVDKMYDRQFSCPSEASWILLLRRRWDFKRDCFIHFVTIMRNQKGVLTPVVDLEGSHLLHISEQEKECAIEAAGQIYFYRLNDDTVTLIQTLAVGEGMVPVAASRYLGIVLERAKGKFDGVVSVRSIENGHAIFDIDFGEVFDGFVHSEIIGNQLMLSSRRYGDCAYTLLPVLRCLEQQGLFHVPAELNRDKGALVTAFKQGPWHVLIAALKEKARGRFFYETLVECGAEFNVDSSLLDSPEFTLTVVQALLSSAIDEMPSAAEEMHYKDLPMHLEYLYHKVEYDALAGLNALHQLLLLECNLQGSLKSAYRSIAEQLPCYSAGFEVVKGVWQSLRILKRLVLSRHSLQLRYLVALLEDGLNLLLQVYPELAAEFAHESYLPDVYLQKRMIHQVCDSLGRREGKEFRAFLGTIGWF